MAIVKLKEKKGRTDMEHKLAENIRMYRKERQMTQEDLAEKLNLTVGTISKWERGSSEPELIYLMQLAQIFHVSLDALLGFTIRSHNADLLVEKIDKLTNGREFDAAKKECEEALLIYPNHFKVVYAVACAYNMIGTVMMEEDALRTAIKHFQHSLDLFSQNVDSEISVIAIQNSIAGCYLSLKETQKGIEELKKNNVCGINDADIAINLIATLKQDQEGIGYACKAMARNAAKLITVLFSLIVYDINEKKYEEGLYTAKWTREYLKSLKKEADKVAFVDKYIASTLLLTAIIQDSMGDWDAAVKSLKAAIKSAEEFDREPSFDTKNIVFLEEVEDGYVYDSLGITSKVGLMRLMDEFRLKDSTSERFQERFRKEIEKEGS